MSVYHTASSNNGVGRDVDTEGLKIWNTVVKNCLNFIKYSAHTIVSTLSVKFAYYNIVQNNYHKTMKKILFFTSLWSCILVGAQTGMAQQLPNSDFEGAWQECIPWTSGGNTQSLDGAMTPQGWTISHVMGMNMFGSWLGSTIVGEKAPDAESNSTVRLYNSPNSVLSSQIVPGYITLGTTWSTAAGMGGDSDGGSFGGVEFTNKPDALQFAYRRSHGDASPDEVATVVAYLWNGTFSQADVPAEIALSNPTKITMLDRDRNILGMETAQGGEVSKTDDAACIARLIHTIQGDATEFAQANVEFDYLDKTATPEKFNIIFSAGDYFSATPGEGNTLDIDDVKLIYYSRLGSIAVKGVEIPLIDGIYEYNGETEMPAGADDVTYTILGANATAEVTFDTDEATMTVTVKNTDADTDGLSEHSYTFRFLKPEVAEPKIFVGKLSVEMGGSAICSDQDATIEISYLTENTCNFKLPNLVLGDLGTLGDINLNNVSYVVSDGVTTYTGRQDNMSLMGGAIIADFVELRGTTTDDGEADMHIDVMWNSLPISVTFSTPGKAGISEISTEESLGPVEYYNLAGIRVMPSTLTKGVYIRKQGKTTSKILVK